MRELDDRTKRSPEASDASHAEPGRSNGVEGGSANVDLTQLNAHPGFDPNRLGNHRHEFQTTRATHLYGNDGRQLSTFVIPAHKAVNINAGAITKLVLHEPDGTHREESCVYIFNYELHSGWMPASALPHVVSTEQAHLANEIGHERGDGHRRFGGGLAIRSDASAKRDGVDDLFTYPHQGVTKKNRYANEAKYYYGNLALNLPDTGAARVGVLTDDIPGPEDHGHALDPYREFFPETPHLEAAIPLYARGAREKSSKHLHFVYGYVKNDAGGRIYGWINKSMLGGHEPKK